METISIQTDHKKQSGKHNLKEANPRIEVPSESLAVKKKITHSIFLISHLYIIIILLKSSTALHSWSESQTNCTMICLQLGEP